jgi:uncharacterized lipoprotein YajG
MKSCNKSLYHLIVIIALIHLVGCTHVGNITQTPPLEIGSPLKSVGPKTFAFKDFQDIRGVEDQSLMVKFGVHTNLMNQLPKIFVSDRIRKEFERNGHKCVDASSQTKADFIVDGVIYKFSVVHLVRWNTEQFTHTGVKLTISRVPKEAGIFVKSYEGEYNATSTLATADRIASILGQAVLSMIKDISTDPELIEFLKK